MEELSVLATPDESLGLRLLYKINGKFFDKEDLFSEPCIPVAENSLREVYYLGSLKKLFLTSVPAFFSCSTMFSVGAFCDDPFVHVFLKDRCGNYYLGHYTRCRRMEEFRFITLGTGQLFNLVSSTNLEDLGSYLDGFLGRHNMKMSCISLLNFEDRIKPAAKEIIEKYV